MPATNGFTVGRDVSININTPRGPLVLPATTTGFDAKPQYKSLDSVGLDGESRFAELPIGWKLTINVDRSDDTLDAFFAQLEDDYFAGLLIEPGTILETTREANGSISQYRYTKVVFKFDDAGSKKGDDKAAQSFSASASRRIKVL